MEHKFGTVAAHAASTERGMGGALYIEDGSVILADRSKLVGNSASGVGRTLMATGGATTYLLPAPPGHWVAGLKCSVYRKSCERDQKGNVLDTRCEQTAADCSRSPEAYARVNGTNCTELLLSQPCNWARTPELIGRVVQVLPQGSVDTDYPNACAAGILGGESPENQTSALCAGLCPPGFLCAEVMTLEPEACPQGSYCPEGSSAPLLCKEGTWSNATSLHSATQCALCQVGSACSTGSVVPQRCAAGSFAATKGQAQCVGCPPGRYQASEGATACDTCKPGFWCTADVPVPCSENL